jgi:hypothetical protein
MGGPGQLNAERVGVAQQRVPDFVAADESLVQAPRLDPLGISGALNERLERGSRVVGQDGTPVMPS